MEEKANKELRLHYKQIRDALTTSQIQDLSQNISDNLLALLESDFKGANIFLCFYPFGSEVNLLPLYKKLLLEGKRLFFPISYIKSHEIIFHEISDLNNDFSKGSYDIMEPKDSLPVLDTNLDNIISITPGLIFDNKCNRIGYGAGFYDRFFARNPQIKRIAVCFDIQMAESIDRQPYDIPMNYIVTNNGIIKGNEYDTY
ncbi:MAG: 5-formyltetrahydrofolate cyclo-ligase [Pseudobutyrivibrio sp.]|nr:5-formyltetrahydrofolate cyclo-ligase [Pseudobutyrivibrio sp.]